VCSHDYATQSADDGTAGEDVPLGNAAAIVMDSVLALLFYYVVHMESVILLLPVGMALIVGGVLFAMKKKLDAAIQSDPTGTR